MTDQDRQSGPGKEIHIFVNNHQLRTTASELTGAQIKQLAGVPADYELFEVHGDKTTPVGNDQRVPLENGMHFRAIPSGTFGAPWLCCLA
jgi:hypothetical protein